jgi:TonB family protein
MNFQITIKQAGKPVKAVKASVSEASAISLKGDLAPAGSPFPAGHTLIVAKGKALYVVLASGMDASLVRGSQALSLADLRAKGQVQKTGALEAIPLPEGAAAEVSMGDWSLSIQPDAARVAAPAPAARPNVSGSAVTSSGAVARDIWAQYRVFSETDRLSTFMRVALASLALHLGIMIFFATRVIVVDPFQVEEMPERFAKFIAPPVEEVPIEAPKAAAPVETAKSAPAEEAAPAPGSEKGSGDNKPKAGDAERKKAISDKVKRTGLLAIIGSSGSGGALKDVLGEGTLSGDLDKALEGMKGSGLGVAKTGEDLKAGGTRGGTGYGTADIGKLETGGTGRSASLGAKAATQVKSEIATGEISASGSLDSGAIASVVKSKISGIKYCYEKELKNNPKLAGKVVVNFTIGETGEVTAYKVENSTINNAEVEQCILRMVRRWKFPPPSGGTVNVSYPFIFTAQG